MSIEDLYRISECLCPDYTKMCAHFEGLVVRVDDTEAASRMLATTHRSEEPFLVLGPDVEAQCNCGKHTVVGWEDKIRPFLDLPSAEVEFHKQEEILIRSH